MKVVTSYYDKTCLKSYFRKVQMRPTEHHIINKE